MSTEEGEIEERKNTITQIKEGTIKFKEKIITGADPIATYKEFFTGIKFSYCSNLFKEDDLKLKIYRVVQWDDCPEDISLVSINKNSPSGRCHVKGFPTFYGTNFISSGIMESMIRSADQYRNHLNEYAGKKFVVGEWHLDLKNVRAVNFIYNAKFNTPTVTNTVVSFNNSIKDKSKAEQDLIKETVKIVYDLFTDENQSVTGALINSIMYNGKGEEVDLIFYPTAINPMIATNFAISQKLVDNPDIFVPVKFNYYELLPVEQFHIDRGMVGYNYLKVGLPDNDKIKWLTDKDSMKRYLIQEPGWYFNGKSWKLRVGNLL